ncbi:LPD38 domain-containing protein [Muribaculum intestinale]|uniref:LPD38 domain-containing protein n=1 Tax=Muribaculum intestinale TaxID=1796646 RepID=UPI00272A191A|nr:LPD38 domain-containing protein [Muribaculum intestinale]
MANEANESTKWLYEQLKGKGYNVGKDVNEFDSLMRSNADSRQWAYDTAKKSGLNVGKDIDEFSSLVGGSSSPAPVIDTTPDQTAEVQPSTENKQEGWKPTPMQKAFMMGSIQSSTNQFKAQTDASLERIKNASEYYNRGGAFSGNKPVKGDMRYNPESGNIEQTYLTPTGTATADKFAAERETRAYNDYVDNMTVSGQLRRAGRDLSDLHRKREERVKAIHEKWAAGQEKNTAPLAAVLGAKTYVPSIQSDPEYRALTAAIHQAEKRIQTLQHESDRQDGKDVGFWRGFGEVVGDIKTWDFGYSGLMEAMTMLDATSKPSSNRPAKTDAQKEAEQIMLEQTYEAQQAQSAYGQNDSFWNRAGVMTGEMLPFMLDFAIMGGAKGGTSMVTRNLDAILLRSLHKAAPKVARNKAVQWTTKALGAMPEDLLYRAPLMTNTVQGMKTSADIIDRKLGDVVIRNDGTYDFSNNKTWGSAIWQGEANAIIENYSEMFGTHLEGVLSLKTVGKLADTFGAKRLSGILTKASNSELAGIAGTMQKHLNQLGVSDYFGEVGEEYYGQLWRTMLNLDDAYKQNPDGSRTNLFLDGQFHGDIWGGMALSMGLMGAGKYSISAAAYGSMKHRVNKTDTRASEIFTPEVWDGWRERIDATTNDKIGEMAEAIVADPTLTDEQRTAAMNYMEASLNLRGFNLASVARQRGGEMSEDEAAANESYMDGYSASTPQEMNDAKKMLDLQRQRLASALSEDLVQDFDNDPIGALSVTHDPELRRIASDYVNAKAVYDGMIQRVRDDVDGRIAQSNAMIDSRINRETGMIQPATMKADDRRVYIVNGTVAMFEDGTGVDTNNSSESIIIRDAETGKVEFADPTQFHSVDEAIDAEIEKEAARKQIIDEIAVTAANNIDGVHSFTPGESYSVLDIDGNPEDIAILGQPTDENGIPLDGYVDIQYPDGTIQSVATSDLQQWVDAANTRRVEQFDNERQAQRAAADEAARQADQSGLTNPNRHTDLMPDDYKTPYDNRPVRASRYIESENGTGGTLYQDENGNDAIVIAAIDNNNYVGYFREYDEQGNPTNRWSAKFQNGSGMRENHRDMMLTAQELLPAGHELTEHTSVSTDGLRNLANQLKHGYELQYDEQGNIITTEVAVNMMARENELGLSDYEPGSIDPARVTSEEYKEAATRLIPYMEALGLSKFNIHWEDGTLYVDHPILRRADTPQQEVQPTVPENAETVLNSDENAEIPTENRDLASETVPKTENSVENVQQTADDGFIPIDPELINSRTDENGNIIWDEPQQEQSRSEEHKQAALSRVPLNEKGKPDFGAVDADTAWDAILEKTSNEAMAQSFADNMVAASEAELKKAEKVKTKPTTDIDEFIVADTERIANIDRAKTALDHWKKVAGTKQRRQAEADAVRNAEMRKRAEEARVKAEQERAEREEAERIEREALNGVPDWSRDTPQDARARGYRRNGPQKVDRQENVASVQGKEIEVKFGDNELPKGHATIIDASTLQPSHIQGSRNPAHSLDEAQPKERDDAASILSAQKIASNIRPEEITSSVTAYTGAPTVNLRGETIQGNSRSDALRLMYESNPEQAAKYKQYLIDHAIDYGLTPEQIASVEHPVLVNMLDVTDDEAIRLGQFVAQDTESGGIERIKPKNAVQKMGNKIRNFANILLRSEDDETSLSQLIETNGTETLKWMSRNGFITDTQYGSAFDSKGELSAKASEDLKGILYQSIFTGGSTRLEEMFNKLPAKAQRAILATAFRDYDSKRADRMIEELQQSIIAFYDLSTFESFANTTNLKDAMAAVEAWKHQYAMDDVTGESYLPAENFSNFALKLTAIYKGGSQKFIQQTFNDLFDTIQGTAQDTLFEEADKTPKSLAEAIRKVLELEYQPVKQNDNGHNGSDAVDINTPQGETRGPRSGGNAESGERESDSAEPADSGAGTSSDSRERDDVAQSPVVTTNAEEQESAIQAEEDALNSRIEVKDDDWTEGGGYTPTLKRTIVIDGIHNVTQVDAPNDKGDYTGSNFEYEGKTFGDLREVISYIDSSQPATIGERIAEAEAKVNTTPTDGQKKAGNYKKGHVQVGTFDVTIENPKGSKRSGTDADGKKWETTMTHTYGYIRGTKGVDGDHIDVYISSDVDDWNGRKVFVVDQYNPNGSFDEHKVMLGFNDKDEAFEAYLSNYEAGWENGRRLDITAVNLENFEKWIDSSKRKTKAFAEYKSVKAGTPSGYSIEPKPYTNKQGKTLDTYLVTFDRDFTKQEKSSLRSMAKDKKGWYDKETGGWMLRSYEDAEAFAKTVVSKNDTQLSEEAPLSLDDMQSATKQASEETSPTNSEISSPSEETSVEKKAENPSGNKLVTDEQYAELLAKMRKKMGGQLNMGVDPEILAIGSMMAVYHIEKGARKFAEYVKAMVADLGEKFPARCLKGFYKAAHEMIEDAAPEIAVEMDSDDVVNTADVASIISGRIDAMATAEMVVEEETAEQEREEAERKLKDERNVRLNPDGSTSETVTEGGVEIEVTKGDFIPGVRRNNGKAEWTGQTEEPKKKKSQKKTVSSQSEQPGLFGGLFDEEVTPTDNDIRRNDAVSTERLPSNNRGQSEGNRENPGAQSQGTRQGSERTDRAGEESGAERTRTLRPRLSRLNENERKNTKNNRAERGTDYAPKSEDARIRANIAAIELAQRLIESGEQATPEDMQWLRMFSGWGGLGKAFTNNAYADRIRKLLGDSYQDAVDSRKSAYYTPAAIIDSLWDIAKAMGFQGGTILEGSAGIGNILGLMPEEISERSEIRAVEVDSTTGSILSLLYPDAQVDIQGFEETKIENGSIDLAITNVPFITGWNVIDKTGDKDLSKKFKDIHDFCIAKNIRKLREGGIGIFITSSGTLDNSAKLRAWVTNEGNSDVVGAFRLHNETFGGTGATSDIIVVRKRVNGKKSAHAIDVSEVSGVRTAEYDTGETKKVKVDGHKQEVPVVDVVTMDYNRYFVEHPEHMAGEMHFGFEKGDYRAKSKALYPVKGMNQEAMLSAWAQSFSDMDFDAAPSNKNEYETTYDTVGNEVKVGSMVIDDRGRLCVNTGGLARPLMSARKNKQDTRTDDELISMFNSKKIKGRTRQQCLKDYNGIKKALADVLEYQTTHEDNEGLEPLLSRLNATFDSFVSRYGNLHKNNQLAWLRNDVDYPGILALERYEERGDESGNRIKKFGKTDIFSRRVVEKETIPQPKNVKDGIITSLYISGRVDVGYISEQLGISDKQVREEIVSSGLGFENPVSREMEVSYEYLSGNVREKLRQATANNTDGKYDANIKALEKVVPMNIPAHLIEFALGSSWIEPKLYEDYVKERTGVDVNLTNVGGTWFMKISGSESNTEQNRSQGVYSEELKKTVFGHEILEAAITNRSISVSHTYKRSDGTYETVTDRDATQAVAAKVDEFRIDFKDWARAKMQGDVEMSARMETVYNDRFNNSVPRSIPDEFIPKHFGGQVTEMGGRPFSLRPHQAKAVIRGTTQSQLLAHEVGTGKTFTLISTAMEMRRLGTARKPMIVVQNATVGQFVESAKALYPNAKVLTLEDADRNAQGRKDFYAKIRYNDWDMIVIPQSVLDMIPDSEERQIRFIQDKIAEKMLVLQQMAEQDPDGSSWITKQAEKEISDLENDLAKITESLESKRKEKSEKDMKKEAQTRHNAEVRAMEMLDRTTDDVENFDQMGIDALLVDEAHEYKHLGFATAMQRGVKGVDPSYSKKAQGLYLKTQAVMERNRGRNVIFATGTPISNTAAEIWTFMRYLMPEDEMRDYGIYYFDDFVRNFGNLQQMLEFATNGKFKENNRFAGYVNLPELVRIWSTVTDTVLTREAEDVSDKIPDMEGGKAQDIYLPQTKALRSVMLYVKSELDRYDKMTGKEKKANSHIPLTMYGIAKAAAVDARLVYSDAADEPQSKTNEAVRQTLRSLEETSDYKGTVAIFADNYQNKQSGFNLYEDIRRKLIEQGVPAEQIVVMKSGMTVKKKLEIFDKVNAGEVRVILGSTYTLGTGVNIQERLHTLIHLDAPNRPMDYTQRNGRILRQGNLHKDMGLPVRVLRFGVEDSLDVTAYQRLKTKGAIADSIMNGSKMMENSMETRSLEEDEDVFGDITAQLSGSEYAMLKNQAEKEVRKLNSKLKQWEADQTYIHNQIPRLKGQIRESEKRQKTAQENLDVVRRIFPNGTFKTITIGKQTFSDLESMNKLFTEHNKSVMDISDQIRDNKISGPQTRKLTIDIDGLKFEVTTVIDKEMGNNGGNLFSKASRKITYSCPELPGVEDVPVSGARLKGAVEDIVSNLITGKDYAEMVDVTQSSIDRNQTELKQIEQRKDKEFEYYDELAEAKERLEEYTEKMKAELAEKEAKYADMDADVEVATDITLSEEDSEETEDEELLRDGYGAYSDAEVSMENDPWSKAWGESIRTKRQQKQFAERERKRMRDRAKSLSSVLGIDIEVIEDASSLKGKKQRAKGWYDTKTGKITVVVGNHNSAADMEATILHEAVAHHGLRQLLGEHFDEFLDKVYEAAENGIKEQIDLLASRNGWNRRVATEEYLAGLAEETEFDRAEERVVGWFDKIKRFFIDMLFKAGFKHITPGSIGDNELRYILWRSYQNLANPGRYRAFEWEAEDVAMQYKLQVGEYEHREDATERKVAEAGELYELNERFNRELEMQIDGTLPAGHVYNMGMPSKELLSTGIARLPIRLSASVLNVKSNLERHAYDLSSVRNLVNAIQKPWAIFSYGDKGKAQNLIIGIEDGGRQFLVGISINPTIKGVTLEINSIRNVFPKNNHEWINWINEGKLLRVDGKKEIQAIIAKLRMNPVAFDYVDLDNATKIVENFENPTIGEQDNNNGGEDTVLFRDGDFTKRDRAVVAQQYERMLSRGSWQFREATQDSMLGLKTLYESILGSNTRIENVAGHENAYLYENRMSSANNGEQHQYFSRFMKPLLESIHKLCGSKELDRRILTDYMMAKHGLERNEYMRNEAAANGEDTERDFAGLCGLTGEDDWQVAETVAQQMVDDYEADHNTAELWNNVKKATNATLEKIYLSGLISEDTYNKVLGMYDFYIPLRGWDETTSDEVYGYLTSKDGPLIGNVFKKAGGRNSKADDPIATIAMMADDAIRQGNRNIMKQRFLNFVHGNPSDLVSVNEMWLQHNDVTDEWEPVFADLQPDMTHAEVESEIAKFEAKMEALRTSEPDKYKKGRDARNIPYKVVSGNLNEHQVLVKRNGRTYVMTINGNPRAAQALNRLTNPNVEMGGVIGNMLKLGEYVNRHLSAFYTTRNPDFVVSNFLRDMLYSNCMTWVKENPRYALRFHKNFGKVNPLTLRKLLSKWENDNLSDSNYLEKMFKEFMLNGGETGYTSVKDIEEHKRTIASELKKQGSTGRKAWNALGMQLDLLNRSAENCARFAAFLTSREMGRTLDRSIYDAKDVSVNFNKKGSGGKFVNATGQKLLGKVGSYLGGGGRIAFVFWNAGIQGMTNFGRAGKRNPGKAIGGAAALFTLGYVIPLLAQMLGGGDGDDDDKNAYYNLPEYVRRGNICFKAGEQWITIPLPIEYRAIYGMGELACGVISGNERYSNSELTRQMASQISQVMPLDMLEGGGGISPFIPSAFKPFTEAYIMNKGWTGLPVYKDTPYNKNDPEWTKAYQSADQHLVAFTRWLNETSGGDDYKKGAIDINPAKLEYLLSGTFGGVVSTTGKLKKMGETALGTREFEWRNMLIANRVIKSGDERTANRKLQNEYFKYLTEYEETNRLRKKYENAADDGILGYAERVDFLYNSAEYLRFGIFEKYKPDIDAIREEIKEETNPEAKKELQEELFSIMRELVDELHDVGK